MPYTNCTSRVPGLHYLEVRDQHVQHSEREAAKIRSYHWLHTNHLHRVVTVQQYGLSKIAIEEKSLHYLKENPHTIRSTPQKSLISTDTKSVSIVLRASGSSNTIAVGKKALSQKKNIRTGICCRTSHIDPRKMR